ncbi:tRNA-dependent cyclodipeptide synthase [Streptomyces zagrosensis]|uniref:Cyclodipeptide synthase n=1 Tax=Streptomyces zagrosensis TaxID=1042984 RepID=A0A7W9Q914_9ACTN|nr:tRNA-dependent cyclodipeptide synthase [Streptomyces zagrosensis]MBB5935861.1 cyclo(L-tyrosyl-L-tyrosyl) synthase [Streptomyces zagrosensis]
MFNSEPLTERCGALLPTASHLCIGVSPFNSYFSTERLTALAKWALTRFEQCHFFIPDTVAAYTLEALGYTPARARHKAARQGQYVHNKVTTALRSLDVPEPQRLIFGMERLDDQPRYRELLAEATALFEQNSAFHAACIDATHWVLDRKLPPGAEPSEEQLRLAVRYFLAELPLFADSGGICGGGPSLFVYHTRVAFLEKFYSGELPWAPAPGQGFLVVTESEARQTDTSMLGVGG